MGQVSETLEMIEAAYSLPEAHDRCIEFMLAGLALLRNTLIAPVKAGLDIAERYWHAGEKDLSLESAKVRLWQQLDRGNVEGHMKAAARAVLCTLEAAPPTEDIYEFLDWYTQFLSDAGGRQEEIVELMRKHFLREQGAVRR